MRWSVALLLLVVPPATCAAQDVDLDLLSVRAIAVQTAPWRDSEPYVDQLRKELRTLPGVLETSAVAADMIIEYDQINVISANKDQPVQHVGTLWQASLYRLDCQSPRWGEPPSRATGGKCRAHVHMRVDLGSMDGMAEPESSAVEEFVTRLRHALLAGNRDAGDIQPGRRW